MHVDPRVFDPRLPDKPNHPDFNLLADLIRDNYSMADEFKDPVARQEKLEEVLADHVDPASLKYLAMNRAHVLARYPGRGSVFLKEDLEEIIASAYLDAVVLGIQFERARQAKSKPARRRSSS